MKDFTHLHKIDSQKEFDDQNAIYNEKFRKFANIKNVINPIKFVSDFIELLDEVEYIGLYDHETIIEKKLRISKVFNIRTEISKWSSEKKKIVLEKLKNKKIKISDFEDKFN